jgi:hypothetical protein
MIEVVAAAAVGTALAALLAVDARSRRDDEGGLRVRDGRRSGSQYWSIR